MKKALLIGIDEYPMAPLFGCVNDAEEVAKSLRSNGDDSPNFDDVQVHKNVQSKAKLTELVYNLFRNEDDIALLYFSGHGGVDNFDTFLVTPDAQPFDLGVSVTSVLKIANESNCRNRIIILDCCHSGAFGTNSLYGGTTSFINSGVTILAASRSDEPAMEVNGHGVFTNLFLEALKGGAADITGSVTPGSIYAFIDKALGAFDQRPVFKTNIIRFVALRKVESAIPPRILRNIIKHFPNPEDEFPLDPSFEDTNSPEVDHEVVKPFASADNVVTFKELQNYQSVGLVVPVGAPFMYFAAMESKSCQLTPLGKHYWKLAKDGRIRD